MKIMHMLPTLSSGGVEQVVLELCQGLTPRGIEQVVVSAGGGMVPLIEATGARHITRPIHRKSLRSLWEVRRIRQLMVDEQPDVVHVHSRVPAWIAYLAWRGLQPSQFSQGQKPRFITSFHGFYSVNAYSAIMAKGEQVIAVARFIKEHILSRYPSAIEADKICVIPNAIAQEEYHPNYTPNVSWLHAWEQEFPEIKGKYVLCLPARLTRWKGAEHLAPLLQELHRLGVPAHALIVGETKQGKGAFKKELQALYERAGIAQHVSWVGLRTDLRDIMTQSHVTLSLALKPEAFGKTTLEALALGRPVAGYDHGGVGEQLQDFLPEGKIPLGDTAAMAALLARWYHDGPPTPAWPLPTCYTRAAMLDAHEACYRRA